MPLGALLSTRHKLYIYAHVCTNAHSHTQIYSVCLMLRPHMFPLDCSQWKMHSISLVHLLPRHKELVHTSHAQKVRHEQTPLIPANAESREASSLVIKLQPFRC